MRSLAVMVLCSTLSGCGWFSNDSGGDNATDTTDPSTEPSPDPSPKVVTKTIQTNLTVGYYFSDLTNGKMRVKVTLLKNKKAAVDVPYEVLARCGHWAASEGEASWSKGVSGANGEVDVNHDALFGVCTYQLKINDEVVGSKELTRYWNMIGKVYTWEAGDKVPGGTGCSNIKTIRVKMTIKLPKKLGETAYASIAVDEASTYDVGDPIYFVNTADYTAGTCVFGRAPLAGNALSKDLSSSLAEEHTRRFLINGTWQEKYTLNGNNATAAISYDSDVITYHIPSS